MFEAERPILFPARVFTAPVLAGLAWLCVSVSACADPDSAPVPASKPQKGEASFYGPGLEGEKTANGEKLDSEKLTAASRTLPLGAKARVTNTETGKSVTVTINDRGPYADGRVIDVTQKAAGHLGMTEDGVAPVKVQPLSGRPNAAGPKPRAAKGD
jgi:rare lipoprotein A